MNRRTTQLLAEICSKTLIDLGKEYIQYKIGNSKVDSAKPAEKDNRKIIDQKMENNEECEYYNDSYYNSSGLDRAGHCRQYYCEYLMQLDSRLDEAYDELQNGRCKYAIFDARVVMDELLRLLISHVEGYSDFGDKMLINLKKCECNSLIGDDSEFIDRLHSVRKICNANEHEYDSGDEMSHNKVHFVIRQVKDLLNISENILVYA